MFNLYNRTTSPQPFTGEGASIVLPPSAVAGQPGPAVAVSQEQFSHLFDALQRVPDTSVAVAPGSGWMNLAARVHPEIVNSMYCVLADGRLFLAGGFVIDGGATTICEIYNPATGQFTEVAPLPQSKASFWIVLLPNGKVFVAGGAPGRFTCYLYDVSAGPLGTWTQTASLPATAANPTGRRVNFRNGSEALVVLNGTKVLLAGGRAGGTNLVMGEVLLYDIAAGTFSYAAPLPIPLTDSRVALLPSGDVAFTFGRAAVGAQNADGNAAFNPSQGSTVIYIYSPVNNTYFTSSQAPGSAFDTDGDTTDAALDPPLRGGRYLHGATLLINGELLMFGGQNLIAGGNFIARRSAVAYNIGANTWREVDPMAVTRILMSWAAIRRNENEVLVAGDNFNVDSGAEVFYANNHWLPTANFYDQSIGPVMFPFLWSRMPVLAGQPILIPDALTADFEVQLQSPNLQYNVGLLPIQAQNARAKPNGAQGLAAAIARDAVDPDPTP